MYVWEMVSYRLRVDGWQVWHTIRQDDAAPIYIVHLQRPGFACEVSGPTLTEAYAAAARRAREQKGSPSAPERALGPHFARAAGQARVASLLLIRN